MRRLLLTAAGLALLCAPGSAFSQGYEISCPGALNAYFRGSYEPVEYAGREWYSQWLAASPDRPLPSQSWYYAYPDRDIVSVENTAIWTWAEIKVHCWVYRSLYVTVVHYDPIDYGGYVRSTNQDGGCGGDEFMTSVAPADPWTGSQDAAEMTSDDYEPYDPGCGGSGSGGASGDDGGAESDDSGGEMTFAELCDLLSGRLYYDYLCLQQWNEKAGDYETIWCGTAAICET
jgi:hypothetical protein